MKSSCNLLDYVSSFRERLHKARDLAQSALSNAQIKMKKCFDKDAVSRSFEKGDQFWFCYHSLALCCRQSFQDPMLWIGNLVTLIIYLYPRSAKKDSGVPY